MAYGPVGYHSPDRVYPRTAYRDPYRRKPRSWFVAALNPSGDATVTLAVISLVASFRYGT